MISRVFYWAMLTQLGLGMNRDIGSIRENQEEERVL
jgi:hypothetical protein